VSLAHLHPLSAVVNTFRDKQPASGQLKWRGEEFELAFAGFEGQTAGNGIS
jgi:hypothetical protein